MENEEKKEFVPTSDVKHLAAHMNKHTGTFSWDWMGD